MNKKRTLWAVRIILIALIVCWMMTIFDFSAANGQQSQSYSDGITIKIIRLIKKDCNMLSKDRQQEYFNQVSFFVRKAGHFGEYGILSLLWSGFLLSFESIRKIKKKIFILIPTAISLVYAATDEFHQGFVDGRSPGVRDVFIDTLGGFTAAVFITVITWLVFRRKDERLGKKC